jgi:hypothetical protein
MRYSSSTSIAGRFSILGIAFLGSVQAAPTAEDFQTWSAITANGSLEVYIPIYRVFATGLKNRGGSATIPRHYPRADCVRVWVVP